MLGLSESSSKTFCKIMKIILSLIALLLALDYYCNAQSDTTEHYQVKVWSKQVIIGKVNGYAPVTLYYYEAIGAAPGQPIDLTLPGGSFISNNNKETDSICFHKAACGRSCFRMTYRTTLLFNIGEVTSNTDRCIYRGAEDARMTIRYIKQNGKRYGCDTSIVNITGLSAGAMIALAVTYNYQLNYPAYKQTKFPGHSTTISKCASFWGAVLDLNLINRDVPLLMEHGTMDGLLPFTSGEAFGVFVYGSASIHSWCDQHHYTSQLDGWTNYGHGLTKHYDAAGKPLPNNTYHNLRICANRSIMFFYR